MPGRQRPCVALDADAVEALHEREQPREHAVDREVRAQLPPRRSRSAPCAASRRSKPTSQGASCRRRRRPRARAGTRAARSFSRSKSCRVAARSSSTNARARAPFFAMRSSSDEVGEVREAEQLRLLARAARGSRRSAARLSWAPSVARVLYARYSCSRSATSSA